MLGHFPKSKERHAHAVFSLKSGHLLFSHFSKIGLPFFSWPTPAKNLSKLDPFLPPLLVMEDRIGSRRRRQIYLVPGSTPDPADPPTPPSPRLKNRGRIWIIGGGGGRGGGAL